MKTLKMKIMYFTLIFIASFIFETHGQIACGAGDIGICRGSCREIDAQINGSCPNNLDCCLRGGDGASCDGGNINGRIGVCKTACDNSDRNSNAFCANGFDCCIPQCGLNNTGNCRRNCQQIESQINGTCLGPGICCLRGGDGASCAGGRIGVCKSACDISDRNSNAFCADGFDCCIPPCGLNNTGICRTNCGQIEGQINETCLGNGICCLTGAEGSECATNATCRSNCLTTENNVTSPSGICNDGLLCCMQGADGASCGSNNVGECMMTCPTGSASIAGGCVNTCCAIGAEGSECATNAICRSNCLTTENNITDSSGVCNDGLLCCMQGANGASCGSNNVGECMMTCPMGSASIAGDCVNTCCAVGADGASCGANNIGECMMTCPMGSSSTAGECTNDCCVVGLGTSCFYYDVYLRKTGMCRLAGTCPPPPTTRRRTRGVGQRRRTRPERPNSPKFGAPCTVNSNLLCC